MKKWLIIALLVVAAIQLAVPLSMVRDRERTLREGEIFKFKVAPVDPYDAFRGRFVWLSVSNQEVTVSNVLELQKLKTEAYAALATGPDGYAYVADITRRAPDSGAYVRAKVWVQRDGRVRVHLPIERFYLPEGEAPAAERAIQEASRGAGHEAAVVARVRKGDLVLEDLLIQEQPIREWLAQHAERGTK